MMDEVRIVGIVITVSVLLLMAIKEILSAKTFKELISNG